MEKSLTDTKIVDEDHARGIVFIPLFFRVIAGLAEGARRHPAGAAEPLPSPASPEAR